ncbi:hypothetical protein MKX01_015595 [Papaver californicum]|nr:hypothetical protein MKX01_015595 [Papaver californicum]
MLNLSNYFSSSNTRNVKPLSTIVHSSSSSSLFSPLLDSTQRRFCRSASSETTTGINTVVEDVTLDSTVSSPTEVEEEEDPIRKSAATLDIREDSFYIEEVDCGDPEPRTICSGIVKYVPTDQLQFSYSHRSIKISLFGIDNSDEELWFQDYCNVCFSFMLALY